MSLLFVYGSLMKQAPSHEVISNCKFIATAFVKDYCLYDLGVEMAAILPCSNDKGVYGEVYELDEETLSDVDNFTGFTPNDPDNSIFERITLSVETIKKETLEAETYVLPESRLEMFSVDRVSTGRWI